MAAWVFDGSLFYSASPGAELDAEDRILVLRCSNGDERTLQRIQHYISDYGYTVVGPNSEEAGDTLVPIGTQETVLRELIRRAPRGTGGYD
jgi:hypothetical protein